MRSLLLGSSVVLVLEAMIFALIGAIPPSLRIHWYLIGFGLGLPAAVLLVGIVVALVLDKLGVKPPSGGTSAYLEQQAAVHVHARSSGSSEAGGREE